MFLPRKVILEYLGLLVQEFQEWQGMKPLISRVSPPDARDDCEEIIF